MSRLRQTQLTAPRRAEWSWRPENGRTGLSRFPQGG